MLFCCFGGKLNSTDFQRGAKVPPTKANPGARPNEIGEDACTISNHLQEQQSLHETLSALRCQLAAVQGSWLARIQSCVESVRAACSPTGHVSLFGASPCGSVLVLLGAATSGANGVVSPGHVLPMPGPWLGSSVSGCNPATAVLAMGTVSSTSGELVILGSPARTCPSGTRTRDLDVLVWQDPGSEARTLPPTAESQQVLKDRSVSHPPLPEAPPDDWLQVLRAMATNVDAVTRGDPIGVDKFAVMVSPATPLHAYLVPLRLGSDVVGALLLMPSDVTTAAAALPPPMPLSPGVVSHKGNLSGPAQLLGRELLMGVGAAVVECCLGPHLADIQRVTFAARELAAAPDLQGLASCLSSAVTEALASELHVDFSVRMALVPYAPAARGTPQYGFLLTEQPSGTAAGPSVQQHMLNGGAHSNHPNTTHSGAAVGMELLSRLPTMHSPASRAATRSLTHQSFAERLLAAKHSSSITSGSAPSMDPLIGPLVGGPMQPQQAGLGGSGIGGGPVAVSGMQSFQLTGCGRRSGADVPARLWKARPFSLESTLLASLAAKAAKSFIASSFQGIGSPSTTTMQGLGLNPTVNALTSVHCALDDGPTSSGGPSPMQRCAVHTTITGGCSSYVTVGSSLVNPSYGTNGGGAGVAGLRGCRMAGAVVPHVHAYLNDTDQPSADVVLLLRTAATSMGFAGTAGRGAAAGIGGSTGGGGGAGSYPGLTGSGAGAISSGTGNGPASLVLVMGSVALVAEDTIRGPALATVTAEPAGGEATSLMAAARPSGQVTGNGMALPSPTPSSWPAPLLRTVGSGGGAGGGTLAAGFDVCLALYLTSHERLPASLLCAARNRSQGLLELLLPAASACLSEAASEELQYLWDAVSGSPGASMAAGGSGVLGRAASVPISRMHPKASCSTAEDGGSTSPHLPLHLQQQPSQYANPGALAGVAAVDLSAHGPLLLPATATRPSPAAHSVAPTIKTGVSSSGADMASASLSLRGCGVRDGVTAGLMPPSEASGAPIEPGDADGGSLAQLLMTRGTNNITMSTPENASQAGTTAMLGTALTTANGTGWTTFTSLGLVAAGTRDTSETAVRVPRSRLSNATATGLNPIPATIPTATAGTSVFMNSYNSLASALMGSGSVTGKALVTASGGGEDGVVVSTGSPLAATTAPFASPSPTTPSLVQQQSAPSMQRRTMLMLQQQNLQQQQQYHVTHRVSPASVSGARVLARVHLPPRRQVSDLLATMPWDVSDTLTVMRTNMDILVSSFWNTLRSQTTEAAPSPHADEDLRFLRLLRVIGGGGCSSVYLGQLHGLEVAVKVMKALSLSDIEGENAEEEQQQSGTEPSAAPPARQAQMRAIMRGARELAVMTSISHPNIVQIYSYHTRVMVKHDAEQHDAQGTGGSGRTLASTVSRDLLPRLIPVPESSMAATLGPLQTVLIMECCDLGSLADALDSGMFATAIRNAEAARWRPGPRRSQTVSMLPSIPSDASAMSSSPHVKAGGSIGSGNGRAINVAGGCGMRAIYLTLLEVALALRHMHAMQLVHCDVKPANVLLKSSASDPRGFTCKLTDFGFVNLLQFQVGDADDPQARPCMRYHEPVGTVTHLAPETMVQGSKLDHTVDIFAFGILMWEIYTGKAPYAEHATNNFRDVPYRVVREGLRPTFPASTPLAFKSLAQACWSADVSRRPTAAVLVASLQRLMDAAARG